MFFLAPPLSHVMHARTHSSPNGSSTSENQAAGGEDIVIARHLLVFFYFSAGTAGGQPTGHNMENEWSSGRTKKTPGFFVVRV